LRAETAQVIVDALKEAGINFVVYMPDSFFYDVIVKVQGDPAFASYGVPNESIGLNMCAGAWLGGKRPVMIMENTGLLVASNSLTRFHQAFGIPALMLISYRGDLGDGWWMVIPLGHAFEPVLRGLQIGYELVEEPEKARRAIVLAQTSAEVSQELKAVVFRKEGSW